MQYPDSISIVSGVAGLIGVFYILTKHVGTKIKQHINDSKDKLEGICLPKFNKQRLPEDYRKPYDIFLEFKLRNKLKKPDKLEPIEDVSIIICLFIFILLCCFFFINALGNTINNHYLVFLFASFCIELAQLTASLLAILIAYQTRELLKFKKYQ
jgi:hypothetical protein